MDDSEYRKLRAGDWVIFDTSTIFFWVNQEHSTYKLADGKPHMITRAGGEDGYHRLGFLDVVDTASYAIGWSYHVCIRMMTKVKASYIGQPVAIDMVSKGDLIMFPARNSVEYVINNFPSRNLITLSSSETDLCYCEGCRKQFEGSMIITTINFEGL